MRAHNTTKVSCYRNYDLNNSTVTENDTLDNQKYFNTVYYCISDDEFNLAPSTGSLITVAGTVLLISFFQPSLYFVLK